MREPSNEVRAHLAKLAKWKEDARTLRILFVDEEDPAMRTVELEMVGTMTGFHEQTFNAIVKGRGIFPTVLTLSLQNCRFEVIPGPVPISTEEGLKIQFPGGKTCLVAVLPAAPIN